MENVNILSTSAEQKKIVDSKSNKAGFRPVALTVQGPLTLMSRLKLLT
jgi:hypothetical protein